MKICNIVSGIFSWDQAALRTLLSVPRYVRTYVRTSVCLSVCLSHPFHNIPFILSSWNFQELLPMTKVMAMQKVKIRGQRSRSQEVKTQLSHSRTVTPVWIYIWWWNDAQSFMLLSRGALLFFKVICQILKVIRLKKNRHFDPNWASPDCNSGLNSPMGTKWYTNLEVA